MKLESITEKTLWGSRYIVIVAVIASILVCIGSYLVATADVYYLILNIICYLRSNFSNPATADLMEAQRSTIVAGIVEVIDGYLLATTMLIFSYGLYEVFISPIDAAKNNKIASRVLSVKSIDDLKERLSKLILLILIVKFFEFSLKVTFNKTPTDLLYFSIGIFLIGASLYLSHKKNGGHGSEKKEPGFYENPPPENEQHTQPLH